MAQHFERIAEPRGVGFQRFFDGKDFALQARVINACAAPDPMRNGSAKKSRVKSGCNRCVANTHLTNGQEIMIAANRLHAEGHRGNASLFIHCGLFGDVTRGYLKREIIGFETNVEYLATTLQDLGAVYIHGGTDAGDESDEDTREGKIRLFHSDPSVMALIANPAAAGEGISLHTVCHRAIYLDRNFNAAQYLQSEDRIHRLGLNPDQETVVEIVECMGTVDETVRQRLGFKVAQMAAALNDPGLNISPLLVDPEVGDEDFEAGGLDEGDVRALLESLGGSS